MIIVYDETWNMEHGLDHGSQHFLYQQRVVEYLFLLSTKTNDYYYYFAYVKWPQIIDRLAYKVIFGSMSYAFHIFFVEYLCVYVDTVNRVCSCDYDDSVPSEYMSLLNTKTV